MLFSVSGMSRPATPPSTVPRAPTATGFDSIICQNPGPAAAPARPLSHLVRHLPGPLLDLPDDLPSLAHDLAGYFLHLPNSLLGLANDLSAHRLTLPALLLIWRPWVPDDPYPPMVPSCSHPRSRTNRSRASRRQMTDRPNQNVSRPDNCRTGHSQSLAIHPNGATRASRC